MTASKISEALKQREIPGRLVFATGPGGLVKALVTTPASTADIFLHGAHVAAFQKRGEGPLLYLSPNSLFAADKPIRGGVPICFPWFGNREGDSSHGFVRQTAWDLAEVREGADGAMTLRFRLPDLPGRADWRGLAAEFTVTVAETLTMELTARNQSDRPLEVENCLHTYFHVGHIKDISLTGLQGTPFLDNALGAGGARKVESDPVLRIERETNRIYPDSTATVEIHDARLKRVVSVEKTNSASTVVWNPWTTQPLPDMKPEEHTDFVCVESANVKQNKITLAPGAATVLKVVLRSRAM